MLRSWRVGAATCGKRRPRAPELQPRFL